MATPLFEFTGQVSLLTAPKQATKKIWHRDLIMAVDEFDQAGEGTIKIQFSDAQMALLDSVLMGDIVTVKFFIRGVEYYWEGANKHLIVLMGQQLRVHAPKRKKGRTTLPSETTPEPDYTPSAPPLIRLGSRSRPASFGEEPPF